MSGQSIGSLVRPDTVTTIMSPDFQQDFLKTDNSLLVVVCSAGPNFAARETARQSWMSDQQKLPNVNVVFLLGTSNNSSLEVRYYRLCFLEWPLSFGTPSSFLFNFASS